MHLNIIKLKEFQKEILFSLMVIFTKMRLMMRRVIVILFVSVLLITNLFAQFQSPNVLDAEIFSSQDKLARGKVLKIAVVLDITDGLHINSNAPRSEFAIPTVIKLTPIEHITFSEFDYPEPLLKSFSFSEEKLSVFEGKVIAYANIHALPELTPGNLKIKATVSYQGCDDQVCFAPEEKNLELLITVVDSTSEIKEINQGIFASLDVPNKQAGADDSIFTSDELKAKQIIDKGFLYAVFAFFIVGLALNLTPCVYPVIPLTVTYFGGQSATSKSLAFFKALFYVVGIAIAFAVLGLLSGLAGKQWGFLFQSPWFIVFITLIILSMAASLFGVFEITVPQALMSKIGSGREGVAGSLIMGLTVGVVIAPCAAGIIIGLVGLVAKLGLVVKGTFLFFLMGLGLGLPYLFLAMFSGLLEKLPQSGMWMVWIRKLFGMILIGVAVYFFLPQLERVYDKLGFLLGLITVFSGLLLGFLDHEAGYTKAFKIGKSVFGILLIVFGIFLVNNAIHAKGSDIDWNHYNGQRIEQLVENDKPVFIDFYADWCAPCKQLDRETFTDKNVVEISKNFNMIKVDCTAPDAITKSFMDKFKVSGMPTLVFLSKDGKEDPALREIGFVGPEEFIKSLNKVLNSQ